MHTSLSWHTVTAVTLLEVNTMSLAYNISVNMNHLPIF